MGPSEVPLPGAALHVSTGALMFDDSLEFIG
jgi:hypothetical protein